MSHGKYIVIEGHDGTGKSTQVELLRKYLSGQGVDSIAFHEPDGTPIATELRAIIVNGALKRSAETNVLLFTAARHEIWHNRALPALNKGTWVIASRNYYSTLAYQGYGEGVSLDLINSVTHTFTDERYMKPDLAVILSLDDSKEREKRIGKRGELAAPDTFESRDELFQHDVQAGYLAIAKTNNLPIISAQSSPEIIFEEIISLLPKA